MAITWPKYKGMVDIPEGWKKIIEELTEKLNEFRNAEIVILQIKEKFGTLRFYYNITNPQDLVGLEVNLIMGLIAKAEERSSYTCERCGAGGVLRTELRWIKTLCGEHYDEERKRPRATLDLGDGSATTTT